MFQEMKELSIHPDNRLDAYNASLYLGLSKKTLAMMRCNGNSPKFIKLGNRVFYMKRDLDEWIQENSGYTSTSQARIKKKSPAGENFKGKLVAEDNMFNDITKEVNHG